MQALPLNGSRRNDPIAERAGCCGQARKYGTQQQLKRPPYALK